MTTIGQHPLRLDLAVHPGDPIDFSIPILDAAGAAQDLSGWAAGATATAPDGQLLHDFVPVISGTSVRVVATTTQTRAWQWSVYAARLAVTATPPSEAAVEICVGWIRFYRP